MTARHSKTPAGTSHPLVPAGPDVPAPAGAARAHQHLDGEAPPSSSGINPAVPVPPFGYTAGGAEGEESSPRRTAGARPETGDRTAPEGLQPPGHPSQGAPTPSGEIAAPAPVEHPRSGAGAATSTPGAARTGAAAPGAKTADGIARWRKALADRAAGQRRARGKHRRAEPGYQPGMARREPPREPS